MIVFENEGEIDPQLIALIGVNVKETENAIGFFGTGLKYAIARCAAWGENMTVQSGLAEFRFHAEDTVIRGQTFSVISMRSRVDVLRLGFTTELGKQWEPWMVYRELWCNAHDEPKPHVYETDSTPPAREGLTRVIVDGPKIAEAHRTRQEFILERCDPLHKVDGLEIHSGAGNRIFYRGIAVQKLDKPSLYTYNITSPLTLTEDRTANNWYTDPVIARGLTKLADPAMIDQLLTAPETAMESRLDYGYAWSPEPIWIERAQEAAAHQPLNIHRSVLSKFVVKEVKSCPTCGRAMPAEEEVPF